MVWLILLALFITMLAIRPIREFLIDVLLAFSGPRL